jgi:UDP-N-acetyl-D-glucosamine/UDP-N-acetyl-D-galactosamine dehydrogenase
MNLEIFKNIENIKIGIIGLGYVGLPLALAFSNQYNDIIGFDLDIKKIELLKLGIDPTKEGYDEQVKAASIHYTSDKKDLTNCNFIIVCVPTPIDNYKNPNLKPLESASQIIGEVIDTGCIIVYESTVYPGVTEEICGPIIEKFSGLKSGVDFKLGYSPERINPGDKERTIEKILKIVSGQDQETLTIISEVYGRIIQAGIYEAPSIKVAEAAKVIENTQRDINIALMNELSIIFDIMNIPTTEVLKAAGTKWNFLAFKPGLVGGHCIGVDPYYLTTKAEELGYIPQVILAGRRINDSMSIFVAQKLVKLLVHTGSIIKGARVGILGITFKENVADIRNSKVHQVIEELTSFGVEPLIHDPLASSEECQKEYGFTLSPLKAFQELDGLVLAVAHDAYKQLGVKKLAAMLKQDGVFIDIKSLYSQKDIGENISYWSL